MAFASLSLGRGMEGNGFHKQATLPGIAVGPRGESGAETIPDNIGPYRIQGLISSGGMSQIFLGVEAKTHDPVAIKVLRPKYIAHPELKERLLREAEIISLADHPNIVKVYGHGEWENGVYLAIEFIQGISLEQFIRHNTVSLKRALEITLQVAYALVHLHSHGVIHRDLKPSNVLLTASGRVKVIDFGIAQLRAGVSESKERSVTHQLIGTPAYMAPEQREHPEQASCPADIYSLAIIAYELILGRFCHGKVILSLMPRGLQQTFRKALARDPAERYSDILSFVDAISTYLQSEALARDQEQRGYWRDLGQNIQRVQDGLLPKALPKWDRIDLGLSLYRGPSVSGIYYDFFEGVEGDRVILLGEPSLKGAEGVVHCALLQGMIRSLVTRLQDPIEVISALNKQLCALAIDDLFTLSYLILQPSASRIHFLSCGYGFLWLLQSGRELPEAISSENIALGIDPDHTFYKVTHRWNVGDTLLLSTYRTGTTNGEEEQTLVRRALVEFRDTTPQKQAEGVMRQVVTHSKHSAETRPIMALTIRRTR